MSIEILDSRIKGGVNLKVKDGITYFSVIFYCSSQSDLDDVLPDQLYHEAWWAKSYCNDPNIIPKVINYEITRIIPGADFPCIVTLLAADKLSGRLPIINTSKHSLGDVIYKKFKTSVFYWNPKYFGIREANEGDVSRKDGKAPYKVKNPKVLAKIGDWIYINYEDDGAHLGSPDMSKSPFADSFTPTHNEAIKLAGTSHIYVIYNLQYYVKGKHLYKYANFSGINGEFPKKYKPGFDDNNNSKKWIVTHNEVELIVDDKNHHWCKITREFMHAGENAVWNGNAWTWK